MQFPESIGQEHVWGWRFGPQTCHELPRIVTIVPCDDPGQQRMRSCCICLDGLSHYGIDDLVRVRHKAALSEYGDQCVAHGFATHTRVGAAANPRHTRATEAHITIPASE